jgi:hypothetical protein
MKNTLPPIQDIQDQLSAAILMMMAGFFDKINPAGDTEGAEALMKACKLVSDGIAKKLATLLAAAGDTPSPETWKEMVQDATANAFIKLPGGGPPIKMSSNPSFAKAIEDATAKIVARPGSRWTHTMLEREEKEMRQYLERMKVPPAEIRRLLSEWRVQQTRGPGGPDAVHDLSTISTDSRRH